MKSREEIVKQCIDYFFSRIVGFENIESSYISIGREDGEYLSIAMDKIDRLTRKSGRLRTRVWSNCYFIFHEGDIDPDDVYMGKVSEVKRAYPYLFIRSYVYFVFVNISWASQASLLGGGGNIKTSSYKIWVFNSKYEIREESKRSNIFGIALKGKERVDDYVYLANPESELRRMESANSDAIDCVRAFTGDLELLSQTSEMLDRVRADLDENPRARILVEGPARSGKTIIAATLLGEYENSKFLLMNYYFYQAIVDGFHALSGWSPEEIEDLVKNPHLDFLLDLKDKVPEILKRISSNLEYAIKECERPRMGLKTKKLLIQNISELAMYFEKLGFNHGDLHGFRSLINLKESLSSLDDENPFSKIDSSNLKRLRDILEGLLSGKYDHLPQLQNKIARSINDIVANSKQKFFHHNINKNISAKISDGCWIKRGNPTVSKMWSDNWSPQLIICDEVQRLGIIPRYGNYDEYNEIEQLLAHSSQTFFTGDDFQMLNSKYDKGIERIDDFVNKSGGFLSRYRLPDSVGVPAEIGLLMKYLTNPLFVEADEVARSWVHAREFEIVFICQDVDLMIRLMDEDGSNKKHIASPMDYDWLDFNEVVRIDTKYRNSPIISLSGHEKKNFSYTFPYFCNEEIMPNYILSAYELISREVESLYIHIPKFLKKKPVHYDWYRKHLYVLFTRPTARLVVNFDVLEEFEIVRKLVVGLVERGAKLSVSFLGGEYS